MNIKYRYILKCFVSKNRPSDRTFEVIEVLESPQFVQVDDLTCSGAEAESVEVQQTLPPDQPLRLRHRHRRIRTRPAGLHMWLGNKLTLDAFGISKISLIFWKTVHQPLGWGSAAPTFFFSPFNKLH